MKKSGIIAMVAVCMIVIGGAVAVGAYFISGGGVGVVWESGRFRPYPGYIGERRGSEKVVQSSASFPVMTAMQIEPDIGDVELIPVEGATEVRVEYSYIERWGQPRCSVENGTLFFKGARQNRDSLNLFGWNGVNNINDDLYVRIYFPPGQVFDWLTADVDMGNMTIKDLKTSGLLKVTCDLGNLRADRVVADRVEINNSAGDIDINKLSADTLICDNDLGQTNIRDIEVARFEADCSAGEVVVEDSRIGQAEVQCDLGGIQGRNIVSDGLSVNSSAGEVRLSGELRGKTEIDADMGSVRLDLTLPKSSYAFDLEVDMGSIRVDGEKQRGSYKESGSGENTLEVDCSAGDVEVNFK